jgi:hypothetical protein
MDNNFTIKPRPGAQKYAPRDPVPVREAVDTDLDAAKAAGAPGDPGRQQHHDPRHDHAPHDVVADPESREVINRENDVRAQANEREHPDQALLRQRAYRPACPDADAPPANESHANIKA